METTFEALYEVALEAIIGRSQHVNVPEPVLSSNHKTCPSQVSEVPGGLGLRYPENIHNIPDTELPAEQQMEDAQPGPVRECPEHQVNFCFAHCACIRPHEYSITVFFVERSIGE